jgi:hypothetical protein
MTNFKFDVSFDDSKLRELQRKSRELNGQHEIPLTELLPDDFIREYTDFQSLQAMVDTCGIENFKEPNNPEFIKFISTHTKFSTWEEMLEKATIGYTKHKLGL